MSYRLRQLLHFLKGTHQAFSVARSQQSETESEIVGRVQRTRLVRGQSEQEAGGVVAHRLRGWISQFRKKLNGRARWSLAGVSGTNCGWLDCCQLGMNGG